MQSLSQADSDQGRLGKGSTGYRHSLQVQADFDGGVSKLYTAVSLLLAPVQCRILRICWILLLHFSDNGPRASFTRA